MSVSSNQNLYENIVTGCSEGNFGIRMAKPTVVETFARTTVIPNCDVVEECSWPLSVSLQNSKQEYTRKIMTIFALSHILRFKELLFYNRTIYKSLLEKIRYNAANTTPCNIYLFCALAKNKGAGVLLG